jgi:hypothetical protein
LLLARGHSTRARQIDGVATGRVFGCNGHNEISRKMP